MVSTSSSSLPSELVIVGAAGRLGAALVKRYSEDHTVRGLTRDDLDLSDPESVRRALEPLDYDRLILPGGLTAVDYCEDHEDEAFAVNANGPRLVAEISAAKGAHLTYISTDFVFDGCCSKACHESLKARPLSVYGASKLEGEENVLGVSDRNLVARLSWLFGAGKPAFPEWIIQQAMKHDDLSLPEEKTSSPSYSEDVVGYLALLLSLDDGGPPAGGIYHLSNSGQCTWREWGQFCLDEAAAAGLPIQTRRMGANCLEDIAAFVAKRPINSVLDTSKFTQFAGFVPRPWQEAMRDHFARTLGAEV